MALITFFTILCCCSQLYICAILHCVFFFKQKTAYEMRISDWSSDVCSSDLVAHRDAKRLRARSLQMRISGFPSGESRAALRPRQFFRSEERSCRERVCQYV